MRYTDSDDDLVSSLSETDIEDDIDNDSLDNVMSFDSELTMCNAGFLQRADNKKVNYYTKYNFQSLCVSHFK